MQTPPIPADEAERLEALRGFAVLDTPAEAAFDRFTRLAARLFDVPMALVTLVDSERQWFKSAVGLGGTHTSRDASFCGHAILGEGVMEVRDAKEDVRFHDNPLVVGDPLIRFYAGAPLRTADGHSLGALCVIDRKPRALTDAQRELLAELGQLVMEQLEHRRARLLALRESAQLHALLAALPAPVTVHQRGDVVFANAQAERVLRVPPGSLVGRATREFLIPGTQTAGSTPQRLERKLRAGDGGELLVESTPMPLRWKGEDAVVALHRDVGAERAAAASVARHLNELQVIFDELPEGVVVADDARRCVYTNRAMSTFLGVPRATLLTWTLDDVAAHAADASDDPPRTRARLLAQTAIEPGASRVEQLTLQRPRAQVLRRHVHRLAVSDRPWISVWSDVTEQAAQLKQSQLAASTDALTKLPNRRAAEAELEVALASGGPVSVVLFDVDHFKKVNDTFGHDVGDEVLVRVGEALKASARAGDFVARWGGEEFLAVVRADEAGARRLAERVRVAVEALTTRAGRVTISGGLAPVRALADVKRADEQLYEAKRQGRNRIAG